MEGQPVTALKATTASNAPRLVVRRGAVAVAALATGAALVLSGCSSGQQAQTAREVSAVNGNTADVGQVALRDVRFLLPQSADYSNTKGGKALLAFTAANDNAGQADEISSITTDLGTVKITPSDVTIDASKAVVAGGPGSAHMSAPTSSAAPTSGATPTSGAASSSTTSATPSSSVAPAAAQPTTASGAKEILVEVDNLTQDLTPGLTYPVTFNFKEAGTVLVNVPIDASGSARKAG